MPRYDRFLVGKSSLNRIECRGGGPIVGIDVVCAAAPVGVRVLCHRGPSIPAQIVRVLRSGAR